jgi:hypothetical protein
MPDLESWIVPFSLGVAFTGAFMTVAWLMRPRRKTAARANRRERRLNCDCCGKAVVFTPADLTVLSPVEKALVVRSRPAFSGRELRELICPACETAHCFVMENGEWAWAGSNLYVPHERSAHCSECGHPIAALEKAPEDPAVLGDARTFGPQAGMRCQRCNALVCFPCLLRQTRGYQTGDPLICPRCTRAAVGWVPPRD